MNLLVLRSHAMFSGQCDRHTLRPRLPARVIQILLQVTFCPPHVGDHKIERYPAHDVVVLLRKRPKLGGIKEAFNLNLIRCLIAPIYRLHERFQEGPRFANHIIFDRRALPCIVVGRVDQNVGALPFVRNDCAATLIWRQVVAVGVHEHTVGKWRRRFVEDRLEGLTDEYRPGRPRTVSDAYVAQVIERTLNTTPKDATHWSIRSMATDTGLSHTTIRRIWAAFGLQPHRSETFKLSTDPLLADKVQDIVGLYMSPPNRAVVLCVDEKSQIQAPDSKQPILPMAPGA